MAGLKLSDIVVPEFFNKYVVNKAVEKSALFKSGILRFSEEYDRLASMPGKRVMMPYFEDLTGESEHISEDNDLTANKIGVGQDIAPIIRRAKMWSATDLAAAMSGEDPIGEVANLIAEFWCRDMQRELFKILTGAFDCPSMKCLNYSTLESGGGDGLLSPEHLIGAMQLLGDASEDLKAIVMHSDVKAYLRKKDLIETVRPSDSVPFDTYMGLRVIVDDGSLKNGSQYRSYIFGTNAIAFGNGAPAGFVPLEFDRDRKKGSGVDYIISRKTYILHPVGVAYAGTNDINPEGPKSTDLANPENWERAYEPKQIKIVSFDYKIS